MKNLRFRLPSPPSPLKNSRRLIRTRGGGVKSLPSKRAAASLVAVRAAAIEALTELRESVIEPMFGDDDIRVVIRHMVEDDSVVVEVSSDGPKPKGKNGRSRDLDNMASTILDALQGLAYVDDRAVVSLQVERITGRVGE